MIKHCKYRNFWRGNKQGLKWARSHRVGVPTLFDLAGLIAASCLQLSIRNSVTEFHSSTELFSEESCSVINTTQNAQKLTIFRSKIKNFLERGPPPRSLDHFYRAMH